MPSVTAVTAACPEFKANMFKPDFCTNCQGEKSVCGGHPSNKGKKLKPVANLPGAGGNRGSISIGGGGVGGGGAGAKGGNRTVGKKSITIGGGMGGRSSTGNGPDRDPDTGLYATDDAKSALKKIIDKNMRSVICTVNGDSGITLVGQPVPFTDGDLAGDLAKTRDMCNQKGIEGLVVVVRPTKEKLTKVYQIPTAGMKMRSKMILANASLWVRINGDCYAHGNEINLDSYEQLQDSLFAKGGAAPPPPPPAAAAVAAVVDSAPPPPPDDDDATHDM